MPPVDRRQDIDVQRVGDYEVRREVVADVGAEKSERVNRFAQLIWLLVIIIEIFIGLRVVLRLMAANPNNGFAAFVYSLTDVFLFPFLGITIMPGSGGVVLDVPAIIGMLVYALFGWVLVRLFALIFTPATRRSVTTYEEVD